MKAISNNKKKVDIDRYLVIFCIIMIVVCSVCTVILVKGNLKGDNTGNKVIMDDGTYKIIKNIEVEYDGDVCYTGKYINKNNIKVYGVFEDGGKQLINNWDGELGPIKDGKNTFEIEYNGFKAELVVQGINIHSVTKPINYKLYAFDETKAKSLVVDIKDGEVTFDEAFEGVLFCGDSRTNALISSQTLEKEKVLAENGVGLDHLDTYMQELLVRNPETIILNYGVNSMSTSSGARDEFVQQYKTIIQDLKKALPQTRIIVAAIFPVSDDFSYQQPRMNYINEVNLKLFKMCVELDVEFIDGTDILEDNEYLFNPDGLHFDDEFYQDYWLDELIMKMGIGVVEME